MDLKKLVLSVLVALSTNYALASATPVCPSANEIYSKTNFVAARYGTRVKPGVWEVYSDGITGSDRSRWVVVYTKTFSTWDVDEVIKQAQQQFKATVALQHPQVLDRDGLVCNYTPTVAQYDVKAFNISPL